MLKTCHLPVNENYRALGLASKKYALKSELNPEPMLPEIKKFPLKYCLQNAIIPIGESDEEIEFGICIPNSLNVLKNYCLQPEILLQLFSQFYSYFSSEKKSIRTPEDLLIIETLCILKAY